MPAQPREPAAPVTPAAAKAEFGDALRQVRLRAGQPSYREMVRRGFSYSPATITRALHGLTFPKWSFVAEFLQLCDVSRQEIEEIWRRRWVAVAKIAKPTRAAGATGPDAAAHNEPGTRGDLDPRMAIECPICGAWVRNTGRHTEWHDLLASRRLRWLRPVHPPGDPPGDAPVVSSSGGGAGSSAP